MSEARQSWYAKLDGAEHGPLGSRDLKELARIGEVTPETEVRFGEDGEWVPAAQVKNLFRSNPPPPLSDRETCPYCKEDIARDAIKCKHCGEFLTGQPATGASMFQPTGGPDTGSIAQSQRQLIWCLLGQLAVLASAVPLMVASPELGILLVAFLFLLVVALQVACVFKLAVYCYGAALGTVLGLFSLVPFFGLFVLLAISMKATRLLKRNGIEVGLMGAKLT